MTQSLNMNSNPSFASELSPTVATLATMAELCVRILQFITAGEIRQVFPLSDELRSVRARLSDHLAKRLELLKEFKPSTNFELRQLEQLKLGVGIVTKFDQVHDQWVKVLEEPDGQDLAGASVEQWHIILEKRLPQGWDKKRDLLVVYGEVPLALHAAIKERDQERVLVYDPKSTPASGVRPADTKDPQKVTIAKPKTLRSIETLNTAHQIADLNQLFPYSKPPRLIAEVLSINPPSPDQLQSVKEELRSLLLIANVSENTLRAFGPRWFNQGLENIPEIARSTPLAELSGAFKELPMILISPGPSLEKNILELKQAVGRAVLVAPAQSMKRLHKEEIYPDFIVVIDPQDYTAPPMDFLCADLIKPHQNLIVGVTCHPNVLHLPFSRKYVFSASANASWLTALFSDAPVNAAGTSVSVAATNIGLEWGCNPIALVGQDLAYTGGKQYAGLETRQTSPEAIFEVEGYYGGKVLTSYAYKVALYEFEQIAERLKLNSKSVKLINATEGGARIKGFTQVKLCDFLHEISDHDTRLETALLTLKKPRQSVDITKRQKTCELNIKMMISHAKKLLRTSQRCKRICNQLSLRPTKDALIKLNKEEEGLRKELKPLLFISLAAQEELIETERILSLDKTLRTNLGISIKFFDIISESCKIIIKNTESLKNLSSEYA